MRDAEEPGIVENGDGSYTMHVSSRDGSVDCELTNGVPVKKGPKNTVNGSCTAPSGSGASSNAVVNVTGPN